MVHDSRRIFATLSIPLITLHDASASLSAICHAIHTTASPFSHGRATEMLCFAGCEGRSIRTRLTVPIRDRGGAFLANLRGGWLGSLNRSAERAFDYSARSHLGALPNAPAKRGRADPCSFVRLSMATSSASDSPKGGCSEILLGKLSRAAKNSLMALSTQNNRHAHAFVGYSAASSSTCCHNFSTPSLCAHSATDPDRSRHR